MFKNLREGENFHVVLWLFKDLCWVMGWKLAGVLMIAPTVAMAALIAWRCRNDRSEFLHSLAVVFWIMANCTWMIGEFFFEDTKRMYALPFFLAGMACVAWFYLVERRRITRTV